MHVAEEKRGSCVSEAPGYIRCERYRAPGAPQSQIAPEKAAEPAMRHHARAVFEDAMIIRKMLYLFIHGLHVYVDNQR